MDTASPSRGAFTREHRQPCAAPRSSSRSVAVAVSSCPNFSGNLWIRTKTSPPPSTPPFDAPHAVVPCHKLRWPDGVSRTCTRTQVAQGALFVGKAFVRSATVAGRVEGILIASDVLFVRGSGQCQGLCRYGQLNVEVRLPLLEA